MLMETRRERTQLPEADIDRHPPAGGHGAETHDTVFRRLLGPAAWRRLAAPIRDRFARHPSATRPTVYAGAMSDVRRSTAGAVLAHLCRLIGTPLAPFAGRDVPVRVKVYDDGRGGVVWERAYEFPRRRPITVTSTKKGDLRAGLVECVGAGFGMTLDVYEDGGALHFKSRDYFWQAGSWRIALPAFLTPGETHVVHSDVGGGRFRFAMSIVHPMLGETFFQDGVFHEIEG